jgi:hypothetical protein
MSNPFHSFHVQSGGVLLNKLSKHYRNLSKNKTHKFQPLMLQDNKDLVVPMDLLHVPSSCNHSMEHKRDDYYIYPEQQPTPTLEIIQIRVQPEIDDIPNYPVIEDDKFEEMFQTISTTPSPKKVSKIQKKSAKKIQQKQKSKSKKLSKKKKTVK